MAVNKCEGTYFPSAPCCGLVSRHGYRGGGGVKLSVDDALPVEFLCEEEAKQQQQGTVRSAVWLFQPLGVSFVWYSGPIPHSDKPPFQVCSVGILLHMVFVRDFMTNVQHTSEPPPDEEA